MGNMSYCRFENTLSDLDVCYDHLNDKLSKEESDARKKLVQLCKDIADEFNEEDIDTEEEKDGD